MGRITFFALLFFTLGSLSAQAQNCADKYWGTKTIYQPQQKKYIPAPAGYQAVFINHVGRHGARHLTKDVTASLAYKLLQKADSTQALTGDGIKLLAMVTRLQQIEKPVLKFISIRGAREQQGIGQRMLRNYGNVFKPGYKLNIAITKEERTKQSAEAFLKGLNYTPAANEEVVDNDILRFFSIAPAYQEFESNGNWKPYMEKLENAVKPKDFNEKMLTRFFNKVFLDGLSADEQDTFVDDIFGFSSITNSIQQEITNAGYTADQLNFRTLISCDELRVLDMLNSADEFVKKSSGMDKNGIQVRDAVPLLVSFINTTDSYIATQSLAANLRFAHAETIAPIAALMDIAAADKQAPDILTYSHIWSAASVIPLSSNVQWILYRNKPGKYLIKVMLNEKEAAIDGVSTKTFPYYSWASVRKHYFNKLTSLHVNLNDDMHAYLINLK